jgi:DNA-binding HxlR family transcriptional regulator
LDLPGIVESTGETGAHYGGLVGHDEVSTPVQSALSAVGDAWSVLILREALLVGATRFGELLDGVGASRATLTNRLNRLVESGLLTRETDASGDHPRYRPTEAARSYVGVLLSMLEWGRRWELAPGEPELLDVRHRSCGARLSTTLCCRSCRGLVDPRSVVAARPGASIRRPASHSRSRMPQLDGLEHGVACPIARTSATVGDRWSTLVVQEAFFGVHEFDGFGRRLGIAPNILSNRLGRLCDRGVLARHQAAPGQSRQIYRLTEKGFDFYRVPVLIWQWAVTTMGVEDPHPFVHRWCGAELAIDVCCRSCGEVVDADTIEVGSVHRSPSSEAATERAHR